MMRKSLLFPISFFLLLLVGCGGGPPSYIANDPNALAQWSAQGTSIAMQQEQAAASTRAVQQATTDAIAEQQRQAQARQEQAADSATAVAGAATATADALVAREKEIELDALALSSTLSITSTATADAAALAFQVREGEVVLSEREAEIARQQTINRLIPWVAGTALLCVIVVVAAFVVVTVRRSQPQQAGDTWVQYSPRYGGVVVIDRPQRALPPPATQVPAVTVTAPENVPSASTWDRFARLCNINRGVLGMADNGRPIVLDPQISPHLFIAGGTGMGKSVGGVLPVVSWMLSAGYTALLLGERGSDFRPLYGHNNFYNLREFDDDERVRLTDHVLALALREMQRRDRVLYNAGANNWNEYLQRNPHEAGNIAVVIDEFLALVLLGGNEYQRSMMQSAANLTSQARKFGISLIVTATDPRREAMGAMGYLAVKQSSRMVFGFNDRGSSKSMLGDDAAFNLPRGVFIFEDKDGHRNRGNSFNPTAAEVRAFLNSRPVPTKALPAILGEVTDYVVDTDAADYLDGPDLDGDGDADVIYMPGNGSAPRRELNYRNISAEDRQLIVEAYRRHDGNIAAVQRELFPSYSFHGGRAWSAIKDALVIEGAINPLAIVEGLADGPVG